MEQNTIDINDLIRYLPKDKVLYINTNIKYHCDINSYDEFIIEVKNGKIMNKNIFKDINEYLKDNNCRSYFFEGLVSLGNNKYSLCWGS
jgi:hypothetical protein